MPSSVPQTPHSFRVASDVGGTFTDNLVYDESTRRLTVAKVPTTPANPAVGTIHGLREALALQDTRGSINFIGHGMTTGTNAIIQRRGARLAFLTNAGFRDLLLIGRQDRPSLYDITVTRPEPLVSREDCYTVPGRIDAMGNETTPLDEGAVRRVAAAIRAAQVQAVAICFLHSYANPQHEYRAKDILEEELPGVIICPSADVLRLFREYERATTTVLNAYLMPIMRHYLHSLVDLLSDADEGLGIPADQEVLVMEASGGLMTALAATEKPVYTVLSGPAGGVVASAHIASLSGIDDVIAMDMGGTSTDISLIMDGKPQITANTQLEGIPIRIPVIDINAIGAGGGSLAWIDDGGALRVGPQSAEAIPGPACYLRGGTLPTVTDANMVLGRLGNQTRLGGALTLDRAAALAAINRHVAEPLGLHPLEAAAGILRVAHANIVRGIRVVSVERGHDPRRLTLLPFGGAGPMHGSPVARALAISRLLIPQAPGMLCALGMLVSDIRHDLLETHIERHDRLSIEQLGTILAPLEERANILLDRDGVPQDRRQIETRVDLRYVGQSYEISLPFDRTQSAGWESVRQTFHHEHQRRYGHADEMAPVEVVGFVVTAIGGIATPQLEQPKPGGLQPAPEAYLETRPVYFEDAASVTRGAWIECRIWRRDALRAGNVIDGPAIIEEVSATSVLYPGDSAHVDHIGNLLVEVRS